jgi:hypothetical protein
MFPLCSISIGVGLCFAWATPAVLQANEPREYVKVKELPEQFQGLWARIAPSGKLHGDSCSVDGIQKAELFVGSSWLMDSGSQAFVSSIEYSDRDVVKFKLVSNADGFATVAFGYMALGKGDIELEIGKGTKTGQVVYRYKRCG